MQLLDLTHPSPAANLALDEALLDSAEAGLSGEVLRFWEASQTFVVLGYSNKAETEANLPACQKAKIPVFRRPSGGGTVLQGPGCLNYSLILKIPEKGPLSNLLQTNHYVLEKHRKALQPLTKDELKIQGISDLTVNNLKFSGNAQRRKRNFLLYHGTFLHKFDLSLISKYLNPPSREPEYRASREHSKFVTNFSISPEKIKGAVREIWKADNKSKEVSETLMRELLEKYEDPAWNLKF